MSRITILVLILSALAGCAGVPQQDSQRTASIADARAKISMGRCDMALARQVITLKEPALEQETAFLCLQQGELAAVELLLNDYGKRHVEPPYPDYSAYLLALTDFVRFESAIGDDEQRLTAGRAAHDQLVRFVRLYPNSAYREEVAPRLEQLHEGMARAEYQLAQMAIEAQAMEEGTARLRYIARQYPRSSAARDANRWLEHNRGL